MATFNDEKKQKFSANSGTTGTLPDVTNAYLEQLTSPTGLATEEDKWKLQLNNLGYSGYDWQTNLFNYLGDIGYTGAWNDRFRDWLIDGGSFGPTVLIQLNSGGSCDYIDPDTTCLATGTYEAIDINFTNPANSWVWSIVSGAAAIQGSTTEKTVVVTTNDVGADVDFVLKVVATDTVSTDSAERESALKQDHDNVTEAPAYIGPNINDRDYTVDVPITPVDTFNLFTGDALVFTLEGTWPTGLVIDSASGQITGTPTGALQAYPNLFVRVTNSKGIADSTQLTITLTSSAVAPIFDNGPVPDQDWPIDQAIAQFPIGQFFLTGSFPRDYTIESGALPTGLTMNLAGQINGTPTVEGETGSVVIRCTNSAGFALTNEWNWLTWEAVAFAGPIPPQTATIGVEYTHDYSQYFTGTVSDYVINTASWPPGTVLDPNTGIVTFTPTVEFSGTNALIIANSDYTPPFVLSNNFAWDVTAVGGPAFYALTHDPVTKQLLMQREGFGTPTHTHTSTLYAQDQDGIYQPYSANKPVWVGGRYVDEDNVFADVTPGGADIVPQPYLQYYPAAENELLHSRDFANATNWTPTGCTAVADAVGLDGTPNTGVTVTGTGNTSDKINPSSIAGTIQSTGVLYYRKTGTDATHVLFQPHQSQWVEFNPQDGTEIHTQGIASWDWIDQGDVVKVVVEANGGVDSIYNVYPNRSGGAASIVLLQMERHIGKSIAEVRGLGPIFTTTAAVATDATLYAFDILNHSDTEGYYYVENELSASGTQNGGLVTLNQATGMMYRSGLNLIGLDGVNAPLVFWNMTQDTSYKCAIAYGSALQKVNLDGVYGTEVPYDGDYGSSGSITLMFNSSRATKLRELQRDDVTYAEAQTIIDGLMT